MPPICKATIPPERLSFSEYRYNDRRGGRAIPPDVSPEALEYELPCPTCNQRKARRLQQLK
ncbi:MAG: hypothetical protein Q9184_001981 [Pyrenodesmia sp. 2 TL-2023]